MKAIAFKSELFMTDFMVAVRAENGQCEMFMARNDEQAKKFAGQICDKRNWSMEWIDTNYKNHPVYMASQFSYGEMYGCTFDGRSIRENNPW